MSEVVGASNGFDIEQQWQLATDQQVMPKLLHFPQAPDEADTRIHRIMTTGVQLYPSPLTRVLMQLDHGGISREQYEPEPLSTFHAEQRLLTIADQARLEDIQKGLGMGHTSAINRLQAMDRVANRKLVSDAHSELRRSKAGYWLAYRQSTDKADTGIFISRLVGIVPSTDAPVRPLPLVSGRDGLECQIPELYDPAVYREVESHPTGKPASEPAFIESRHTV